MALLCAALVLAITSLSAFIRLSGAGLGCEPWPQCYGQSLRDASGAVAQPVARSVAVARLAHRVVAMAALVVIIMMVMTSLFSAPILWREGRLALALLGLAVFLAVLGVWTADARVPAVMLGNLLAGFAMFALACRLALVTSMKRPGVRVISGAWVVLATLLLVTQLVLGGLSSAGHAGISCPELARCDPSAGSWQLLNPWHALHYDPADPANAAGALLAFLHRAASLLVLAVLLPLGIVAWHRGHRAGSVLVVLLGVQMALGALLVVAALPLAVALAHNLVAALLLAALAALFL